MRFEQIAVKDLFDDCLRSKAMEAGKRRVAMVARLEDGEAIICGDCRLLRAAIINLIAMAIRRSRPGGKIVVEYRRDAARESIVVADNGCSIPCEQLRNARDIFSRASMSCERDMGETDAELQALHVVKDITDIHNGRLGVRSMEGEGSTFTLHLPRRHRGAA